MIWHCGVRPLKQARLEPVPQDPGVRPRADRGDVEGRLNERRAPGFALAVRASLTCKQAMTQRVMTASRRKR
jgi:hypothetical protein